jgi:pyruvate,water dikinase
MRGVGEIDLGAARWRDDPAPVLQNLKNYVQVTDPQRQPRAVHQAGAAEARRSVERLVASSTHLRGHSIAHAARVIRGLFGARETPKFTIVRAFGRLRAGLDESAAELVTEGRLTEPADLYFLSTGELRRAFTGHWQDIVTGRRAVGEAERRRGQVPRVLLEDGRTFYEGLGAEGDLHGMGVSPGVAEGPVRVVSDPRHGSLRAGDILVCKGTDPAWTPLFLSAAGLITEVGGLMTHGSVVAREYGIPAVVGVHQATQRLTDGQRVRIDGTSGAIEIVDPDGTTRVSSDDPEYESYR